MGNGGGNGGYPRQTVLRGQVGNLFVVNEVLKEAGKRDKDLKTGLAVAAHQYIAIWNLANAMA